MLTPQHSILAPREVLKLIKRQYPAIDAMDCQLLALGCNDNYMIHARRGRFAFRIYRLDWWPADDIDSELRLLEFLKRKGVPACIPKRNHKGKRYISINAPEGKRYGALFHFLPGKPMGSAYGKRNTNLFHLGELTAHLHTASDALKQPLQRFTMDYDFMVTQTLELIEPVIDHREKDLKYLHRLANKLYEKLTQAPAGSLDFGLCHGDLHTYNVMLDNDKLSLFDLDWCGYSWRAYDMATVWWSIPRDSKSKTRFNAFLRGYQQHRTLSKQEKHLLPWFVVLRHFELLCFHLNFRKHLGTAWLDDNYYDRQIDFFRNWEKQHLK